MEALFLNIHVHAYHRLSTTHAHMVDVQRDRKKIFLHAFDLVSYPRNDDHRLQYVRDVIL